MDHEVPQDLFAPIENRQRNERAIKTVDSLNKKFGCNKIQFAAQGFEHEWKVGAKRRSQTFTSRWDKIFSVKW